MHAKKLIHIVLVLFLSVVWLWAKEETVKIAKIIDADLFQIQDGRLICLADVQTPSLNDEDTLGAHIAQQAVSYAKSMILGKDVLIRYDTLEVKVGRPIPVYLFKKYPLENLDIIKVYLQNGYGKYRPSPEHTFNKIYAAAERRAKKRKLGIWKRELVTDTIRSFKSFRFMGGKYNMFENIVAYRSLAIRLHSENMVSLFDLQVGAIENAQKYLDYGCEYSNPNFYTEKLRHFKTAFLQMVTGRKWNKMTLSIGGWAAISSKTFYCSEVNGLFIFSPIVKLRYELPQKYFVQAALNDDYSWVFVDYPLIVKVGKDFRFLHSRWWIGSVKEGPSFGLLGGVQGRWGPALIGADFGYKPNDKKWFTRFEIGLF